MNLVRNFRPVLFHRSRFLARPIVNRMPLVTISSSIKDALIQNEIIPTVIKDEQFVPKGLLIISYGDGKDVVMGNKLTPEKTQETPKISFAPNTDDSAAIDPKDRFTLILTDPDAPTKGDKTWSEYCHYVVKDLEPSHFDDLSSNGVTLAPYIGPGPPPKTKFHRYVFLLYKQLGSSPEAPKDRPNWGTGVPGSGADDYASKHGLELWAVNFFFAQNKDN
ncbi:unnamed protein product [Kuraishia capsulata CBS 1993]|uniref:Phosphatidylethanolamine-binding protein n=1 Tax=Kuraishia capsulata CBS 1993 TaxID=1382522 RepID=W6MXA5_9ASCO|nr:uncharacterized protein KUCA_T00004533001 [Kuraishia capsulata CBS 1993]CDK28550.1 unnamed protein product [Kuraishia capsulata CBS 1993]